MTSSIYPILPSLADTTITTPGSGYTTTPTVTIDPPTSGTTATGTANISNGVINAIALSGTLSGYTDGEEVTLATTVGSGIDASGIAVISGGTVQSVTFTNRGSGFVASDTLSITGVTSLTASGIITVNSITDDAVSSITLTNGGTGYTSAPNITITGGGGSGAAAVGVFTIRVAPIPATSNILISDIEITPDMVRPGGGGILRLYFAFTFSTSPSAIQVFNNSVLKGNLINSVNTSDIVGDGYYRFDIDVEANDNINIQSSESITAIHFIRAHLIQFGA